MKKNMNIADRVIRIIIALSIGVLYYTGILSGSLATGLGVLAIIFVITSFLSFCPIYTLVGLSTVKE